MVEDREPGVMGGSAERPARFFSDAAEFDAWLAAHHATETELWMGLRRKHLPDHGLTWAEAVPVALCWGWIDSVSQRIDDDTRRQRWTPRKRTSNWSRVNLDLVEQLRAAGRMQPSGLAIWEQRRPEPAPYTHEVDGELALPPAYAARLADDPAATAFWQAATPTYRKLCVNWVVTAKQEATRDRRLAQLVECSAAGRDDPQPALRRRPPLAGAGRRRGPGRNRWLRCEERQRRASKPPGPVHPPTRSRGSAVAGLAPRPANPPGG